MCYGAAQPGKERNFRRFEVHGVYCDEIRTQDSEPFQSGERPHAVFGQAFADFVERFMNMGIDRDLQLLREHQYLLETLVADGVGRMRGHTEAQQGLVFQFVAHRQAFAQVVLRIAGIGGGKFKHNDAQCRTRSGVQRCPSRHLGKEVHVIKTGHSATEHLGTGEQGAVIDELRRRVPGFRRPYAFRQPVHHARSKTSLRQRARRSGSSSTGCATAISWTA